MQSNATVAQYGSQAGQARARGVQQKAEAYQKAYALEHESKQNSYLAMQNMMAMRENQASAVSAARNTAGASGFMADTGSQRVNQMTIAEMLEQQIANANKSNIIADENARTQAALYRRSGNTAMALANIEADYLTRLADISKSARWGYLIGDALTLGGQLSLMYGSATGGSSEGGGGSGGGGGGGG